MARVALRAADARLAEHLEQRSRPSHSFSEARRQACVCYSSFSATGRWLAGGRCRSASRGCRSLKDPHTRPERRGFVGCGQGPLQGNGGSHSRFEDVADQKVTILVDSMPLRDVMNRVATLFGWSWTIEHEDDGHDIYVIYDPLKAKRDADRKEALDKLEGPWREAGFAGSQRAGDKEFCKALALLQYGSLSPDLRKHICPACVSATTMWRALRLLGNPRRP